LPRALSLNTPSWLSPLTMSFFSLFCCCLRPRTHSFPIEPNENTPLIPASDDVQPASRHIIIDQQRMKERLGVIVRAKESKMVNVNAPLPFNLTTNGNKQPRISRLHTGSPQPSLDMERQSAVSSASASVSASHELDEDTRRSTLHVRIVRGGSSLARGRPITRDAIAAMHDCRTEDGGESGTAAGGEVSPLPLTAAAAEGEAQSPTDGVAAAGTRAGAGVGVGGVAQIPCTAFKIQNIGSLSRSWGD